MMTDTIDRKELLLFIEREFNRWADRSEKISEEIEYMRKRGIDDSSVIIQKLATDNIMAINRALIMKRLFETLAAWDGSSKLEQLDMSDIDNLSNIVATVIKVCELINADEETMNKMIETVSKVINSE